MSVRNYNYLLHNKPEERSSQVQCCHDVTKIQDQLLTILPIFQRFLQQWQNHWIHCINLNVTTTTNKKKSIHIHISLLSPETFGYGLVFYVQRVYIIKAYWVPPFISRNKQHILPISKIFETDAVKIVKLTIRPIGHRHPRSSSLPHVDTGPIVYSIFGTLPGGSFLSQCQALSAIRPVSTQWYQTSVLSASISFLEIGRSHRVQWG
jgi:hypothetical protein